MIESLSLEGVLFDSPREGRCALEVSDGALPEGLKGSYFLNGPANLERGDFRYKHWLDGTALSGRSIFGTARPKSDRPDKAVAIQPVFVAKIPSLQVRWSVEKV